MLLGVHEVFNAEAITALVRLQVLDSILEVEGLARAVEDVGGSHGKGGGGK